MILRPVRPVSPIGPPITKRPVGLTRTKSVSSSRRPSSRSLGDGRAHHVLDRRPRRICRSRSAVRRVLGRDHDALDAHRLGHAIGVTRVAHRDLGLAVGQQVGDDALAPHGREAAADRVREHDRQRHQLRRSRRRRSRTSFPGRRRRCRSSASPFRRCASNDSVDALRDVRRLLVDRHIDAARVASNPYSAPS